MNNMKECVKSIFYDLFARYPELNACSRSIEKSFNIMVDCYNNDCKLLVAGNGGSASDSEHIAGELMKNFCIKRKVPEEMKQKLIETDGIMGVFLSEKLERPLTVIPLVAHEALSTAYSNDTSAVCGFSQQLYGFGKRGDVFLAVSTSGNSKNIIYACVTAKAMGLKVIGLTGESGGELKKFADVCICVPERETYKIQELHLPVYHTLCLMLESQFFG